MYDFICQFIIENSYSPSIDEISAEFGFSRNNAHDYLKALQKKGYIEMQFRRPRSIKIRKFASIFYGTVGDLFLIVAPKGTAKLKDDSTR